jgi:PIN domain nuclease of toxin-antitoxin system
MTEATVLLLDTHIWLWWIDQDNRLPNDINELVATFNGRVAVSSASVYEVSFLAARQRIFLNRDVNDWLDRATQGIGIDVMPITDIIARQAAQLPLHHGDPLDRIIIATTLSYNAHLASIDTKFPAYEVLQGKLITGKENNV